MHESRPLESAPALARQLAERLIERIESGTLAHGMRLPTEVALGREFGTSRSVVREALSMLRQSGLIVSRRGSGSFVADAPMAALRMEIPERSLTAVIELLELRRAVEVEAARLAASRRTAAQLQQLRDALDEIDDAVAAGGSGVREDMRFHRRIAEAANNRYFTASLDFYNRFLEYAIGVTRRHEARHDFFAEQVIAEHRAIVDAIVAADAAGAAMTVTRHLAHAELRLRDASAAGIQLGAAPD